MERYWRIIHDPTLATIDDVISIFCHKNEYGGRVGSRGSDADRCVPGASLLICMPECIFFCRFGTPLFLDEEMEASLPEGINLDTDHQEVRRS